MNDFQIKCFLTAVKYMNFSKAAAELYITQPSFSRHISNLETELGTQLFDRSGKSVALTEAGKSYYDFFKSFLKGINELRDKYGQSDESVAGTIRYIAFPVWNISDLLMDNTERMLRKHPNLRIEQKFDGTDFVNKLNTGEIDAAFHIYDALAGIPGISCVKLTSIPRVILYSNRHPLARKSSLKITDFRDETFVYLPDETLTEHVFNKIFYKAFLPYGFQPKTRPASDFDSMMFMVESCRGVTLMDTLSRACLNPKLRCFELDGTESIGLAWKGSNATPQLKIFVDETVRFFEEN